jgi:predicted nucleic acid-binding protein
MIVLDSNVISETMRKTPDARVVAWLDAQSVETLYLAAISVTELRFGIAVAPKGRRQQQLDEMLEKKVLPAFAMRILPFDLAASRAYAELMAKARAAGVGIPVADGYIAATAAAHGMMIATRDTKHFKVTGLRVVNPWDNRTT